MSGQPAPAQLDLETELSCSICTDILYQPLTLLDCLHTFCGACLKEWFLSQASRATSLHPYTCPACRASVRATKHNASIATLLDMYLQMNPTKGRTEEEKQESLKIYKAGDNVLPKLRRRGRRADDEDDQRVLNDVMSLSLQDAGLQGHTSDSTSRRRRGNASRERRTSEGASGRSEPRQAALYLHARDEAQPRTRPVMRPESIVNPARSLDHQSSLRSLLSVSEPDVEEEILRQIMEDGLLNGIDLSNMTTAQEDELTERIAAAYRRRQDEQRRARRVEERSHQSRTRSTPRSRDRSRQSSQPRDRSDQPQRSSITTSTSAQPLDTPSSSANLRVANQRHDGRSNSRHRSASADNSTTLHVPRSNPTPASRSASDLPLPSVTEPRQQSSVSRTNNRRSTEPGGQSQRNRLATAVENEQSLRDEFESPALVITNEPDPATSPRLHAHTFPIDDSRPRSSHSAVSAASGISELPANDIPENGRVAISPISSRSPRGVVNEDNTPSIFCRRCGTTRIEYNLHYTCFKCDRSGYSLCLNCYRHGQGCLHWFGFGWAAWQKYHKTIQSQGQTQQSEPPHILAARRFAHLASEAPTDSESNPDNQGRSLQIGVFCDICSVFANDWYWRCDVCNEGEWGYCSSCVNQGRHCTHPLLPLAYHASDSTSLPTSQALKVPQSFIPKALTTACDICTYPIPPSHSRYHCLKCNDGDYDMHLNCYTSLVKSGQISEHNGHNGWRRCLKGHRMVILGFEDRDGGQRRVVVRDLVGGDALREDNNAAATFSSLGSERESRPRTPPTSEQYNTGWRWTDADGTSRFQSPTSNSPSPISNVSTLPPLQFPPDGGVGLRLLAKWGYFPAEPDELMFPKGAEIKEAEDINGDWHWGAYAGSKGLFPGNYGRVVGKR